MAILKTIFAIIIIASSINASAGKYYPPRIQQLCNDHFIGTDWVNSQKYEKRCRPLWNAWSDEIKLSFNQF